MIILMKKKILWIILSTLIISLVIGISIPFIIRISKGIAEPMPSDAKITDAFIQANSRIYLIDSTGSLYTKGRTDSKSSSGTDKRIKGSAPAKIFDNVAFVEEQVLVTTDGDLYCWNKIPCYLKVTKSKISKNPVKITSNVKTAVIIPWWTRGDDIQLSVLDRQDNLRVVGGGNGRIEKTEDWPILWQNVEKQILSNDNRKDKLDLLFITKDKELYSYDYASSEPPKLLEKDVIEASFYEKSILYLDVNHNIYEYADGQKNHLLENVKAYVSDGGLIYLNHLNEIHSYGWNLRLPEENTLGSGKLVAPKVKVEKLFNSETAMMYLGENGWLYGYGSNYNYDTIDPLFGSDWYLFDDPRKTISYNEPPTVFPRQR